MNLEQLAGRRLLDCPAGPSSFVAEANECGIRAVGADPMFYRSPGAIELLARTDFADMYGRIREKPEFFVAKTYRSIDESEHCRCLGLDRFLADYRTMYPTGCYVDASLPNLPFPDGSFDVVLCGHLLFLYAERLGAGFDLIAARELCRVARNEVRTHPVVNSSGAIPPGLDTLRRALGRVGRESELVKVDHEFFRGSNRTLVIAGSSQPKRSEAAPYVGP